MSHLLALDQGTSSTRSIVFDLEGRVAGLAQQPLAQHYPQTGWVEHEPDDIWQAQLGTARQALSQAGLNAKDILAIGITNQRETTLLWDRRSGRPLHRAIVWQDRRAEPYCAGWRAEGLEPLIAERTGLRLDAYFSGPKLRWLLDHIPGARLRAERGELAFGTVDSWLAWQLTGHTRHVTDVSNASRSLLFDIHRNQWDSELLAALGIPRSLLPEVLPSTADFGASLPGLLGSSIPIRGMAGDQQSALFGQACFTPGMAKNTYGTGCFMLMHAGTGPLQSRHGLVVTSTAQTQADPELALEGSVFIAGAVVQWLRDGLGLIQQSRDIEALAGQVPDAGGVVVVPAFTGLGAPYWVPEARGLISGLTRGSTAAHIARAALDSIAYQSTAVLRAMSRDAAEAGQPALTELRVDGGAAVNDLLMQFQADLLGIPVVRPDNVETTALGAAWLAGLGCGVYADRQALAAQWRPQRCFEPSFSRDRAETLMAGWEHAVRQAASN